MAVNEKFFEELVEKHRKKIINICYKFLQDADEAEDTAQEVFIEIYHSLESFRKESSISTWIYRIAVNKSLDALRKRAGKRKFFFLPVGTGEAENLPAAEKTDEVYDSELTRRALQKALDSLPEKQRIAITLNKMYSMSNSEIAIIMDTNISTVDSHIRRAKQNLRKKLYKFYKNLKE